MSSFKAIAVPALIVGLLFGTAGCELITSVNRSQSAPAGEGGSGDTSTGSGGTGGAATGGGAATSGSGTATSDSDAATSSGMATGGSDGCVPEDDMKECTDDGCNANGTTAHYNKSAGDACSEGSGIVCDGNGACVGCLQDANCTAPRVCDTAVSACVDATCLDGKSNSTETDVDCGGAGCPPCGDDLRCLIDDDCASKVCAEDGSGKLGCQAASCGDGVINGSDECDDGNVTASDGCSDTCALESGFTCTGEPTLCSDDDECLQGSDDCGANAACTNLPGSFSCACNAGFTGNGVTCSDANECVQGSDDCGANAACTNLPGSFSCACNAGFTGNGVTCSDANECVQGSDNCDANATCSNAVGSFSCACNAGFTGNGVACHDIDECALDTDDCDAHATCTNTPGSFTCACKAGFIGSSMTCSDADECALHTDDCDANATCSNTVGSFTCACNAGFGGDGVTCSEVDECARDTDDCDANATCSNTPGSFSCACNAGFTGNGVICTRDDEPANNTCAGATLAPVSMTITQLQLATVSDVDWFMFTAAAGDVGKVVHVVAAGTAAGPASPCDTVVEVLAGASCGALSSLGGESDDQNYDEDWVSAPLTAAGSFWVKVSYSWFGFSSAPYTLTVTLE